MQIPREFQLSQLKACDTIPHPQITEFLPPDPADIGTSKAKL